MAGDGFSREKPPSISTFRMSVENGKLIVPLELIRYNNREGSMNLVGKIPRSRPDMYSIK